LGIATSSTRIRRSAPRPGAAALSLAVPDPDPEGFEVDVLSEDAVNAESNLPKNPRCAVSGAGSSVKPSGALCAAADPSMLLPMDPLS